MCHLDNSWKAPTKSINWNIDYQLEMVEHDKYIIAYKIRSKNTFLLYNPTKHIIHVKR